MPVEFVQKLLTRCQLSFVWQGPACLHNQLASLLVENFPKDVPSAVHGDSAPKFGEFVQPFEHGHIRVGTEFIGVDLRIWIAGQHLVVSRIRKGLPVGHVRIAALVLIPEDLPALCNGTPKERKQGLAALVHIVAPEVAVELFWLGPDPSLSVVHQVLFSAGEDFLPAQSVRDDQYDVASLAQAGGFALRRPAVSSCYQKQECESAKPSA